MCCGEAAVEDICADSSSAVLVWRCACELASEAMVGEAVVVDEAVLVGEVIVVRAVV